MGIPKTAAKSASDRYISRRAGSTSGGRPGRRPEHRERQQRQVEASGRWGLDSPNVSNQTVTNESTLLRIYWASVGVEMRLGSLSALDGSTS